MKILVLCATVLFLNGCTVLTIGISTISSVIDRYEKYLIEERLKELEQED